MSFSFSVFFTPRSIQKLCACHTHHGRCDCFVCACNDERNMFCVRCTVWACVALCRGVLIGIFDIAPNREGHRQDGAPV